LTKLNKIVGLISLFFLTIGLIGFFSPMEPLFRQLSIYNLLLTFILVTISFTNNLSVFIKLFLIVFGIGFIAELIGVHTGLLFGNYSYSQNLGLSFQKVPLIIGVNWAILSLGAWNLCRTISKKIIINILIASLLMVVFDIALEPAAINLHYWSWKSGEIPLFNYISWFLISIPAIYTWSLFKIESTGISKTIFISQFLFFIILTIKTTWL